MYIFVRGMGEGGSLKNLAIFFLFNKVGIMFGFYENFAYLYGMLEIIDIFWGCSISPAIFWG